MFTGILPKTELKKFSHSLLLFVFFEDANYRYIDGKVDHNVRQQYIDDFNEEESELFAFCSTTGVGGLGLTITGADRVIVFDPDWNPANDSQAVDRGNTE